MCAREEGSRITRRRPLPSPRDSVCSSCAEEEETQNWQRGGDRERERERERGGAKMLRCTTAYTGGMGYAQINAHPPP